MNGKLGVYGLLFTSHYMHGNFQIAREFIGEGKAIDVGGANRIESKLESNTRIQGQEGGSLD
jgi:hypothetical protein